MTMTEQKAVAEYVRPHLGDKEPVAVLIENAATHLRATVRWFDPRKTRHSANEADITLDGYSIMVEAGTPKWGARIISDDGRYWDYDTSEKLAKAIKSRVARAKAHDAKQAAQWAEDGRRRAAEKAMREAARAQLVAAFGEELVNAAMDIDALFNTDADVAIEKITVFVGKKISGEKLTLVEAVRFTQAMISAGYDLVKINEWTQS